jgi:hypothetical protein
MCGVLNRDLKTDNAQVASKEPLVVKWAGFGCAVALKQTSESFGMSLLLLLLLLLLLSPRCSCPVRREPYFNDAGRTCRVVGTRDACRF